MFFTPARSAKRRLFFTPRSAKRSRFGRNPTASVKRLNRQTTRGPKTSGSLLQQVKSLQRVVKNLSPEVRYIDIALSQINVPVAGAVVPMTLIAQGDTQQTRTGNMINVTNLSLKGNFSQNTGQPVDGFCRIVVVQDKENPSDSAPSATNIISNLFVNADPVSCFPNLDNLTRFKILHVSKLYDSRRMVCNLTTDIDKVPTQSPEFTWDWSGNIKVHYNGITTADIEKNGIYVVFLSNSSQMDFTGVGRIGFTDM